MADPPPRRRRSSSPPPSRRSGGGGKGSGGPLPTIALAIGVVIAGLGIGALISAYQNRGTSPSTLTSGVPTITPVPQPSVIVTASPTPSPSATPAPAASPSPTHAPTASPTTAPTPSPVPTPTIAATASAVPSAPVSAAPTLAPTARPETPSPTPPTPRPTAAPTPRPTLAPSPPPTAVPTAKPAAIAPAGASDDTGVVRRYLDALIAGNESGAYAALGGSAGDHGLTLKEEAFIDKDARVTSLHATHAEAGGSTVVAEISATSGNYVATFHVVHGSNGSFIDQHDYIKV